MYDPPFFTLSVPDGGPVWERQKWSDVWTIRKSGPLKSLEVMCSYWVLLLFCGMMHSPPVWAPFPCIPHHVIQTKTIRRKGHYLRGGRRIMSYQGKVHHWCYQCKKCCCESMEDMKSLRLSEHVSISMWHWWDFLRLTITVHLVFNLDLQQVPSVFLHCFFYNPTWRDA